MAGVARELRWKEKKGRGPFYDLGGFDDYEPAIATYHKVDPRPGIGVEPYSRP
jgi:hypothetical protein